MVNLRYWCFDLVTFLLQPCFVSWLPCLSIYLWTRFLPHRFNTAGNEFQSHCQHDIFFFNNELIMNKIKLCIRIGVFGLWARGLVHSFIFQSISIQSDCCVSCTMTNHESSSFEWPCVCDIRKNCNYTII